jgi:acyl-CoA synthetase (AMP-forming)/AMP-acid ligase II/lauroyl/myristoyl acyltransferase/acyl carrier protein
MIGSKLMNSFVDVVRRHAESQPDRTALTLLAEGETQEINLTYGELNRQARTVAAVLQSRVVPGERVLLLLESQPEFLAAFLGCLYAGVMAVPAAPMTAGPAAGRRLQVMLRDASAYLVLASADTKSFLDEHIRGVPGIRPPIWLDPRSLMADGETDWKPLAIGPDTIALLQYTSGSTTDPRGVMISHGNLLFELQAVQEGLGQTEDTLMVSWMPLYQDGGLVFLALQTLYNGSRCIFMPPSAFISQPLRWLWAISRYRACCSAGSNFSYELCARRATPEQCVGLDLRSWRIAGIGTEPIRAETLERFSRVFAPYGFDDRAFVTAFGLSEGPVNVSIKTRFIPPTVRSFRKDALECRRFEICPPDSLQSQQLVGCGSIASGLEVVIVDPERHVRSLPGEIGEIWISGPGVAKGYWNQPEATEQTFQAYLTDTGEGPFLRTGDLGFLYEGELFIAGRIKDVIIIQGRNHHPQDIEATVEACHPSLRRGGCAAFSVDVDGAEGLVVLQEIKAERNEQIDDRAIVWAIRHAVAKHHGLPIHTIMLLPPKSLPKTTSGKLQRFACRGAFLENRLEFLVSWTEQESSGVERPPLSYDIEREVRRIWRQVLRNPMVGLHDNFFDLGGDSLSALEMTLHVEERFGVIVPWEFFQAPTLANMVQLVRGEPLDLAVAPASIAAPGPISSATPHAGRMFQIPLLRRFAGRGIHWVRGCAEAIGFRLPYLTGLRWLRWWCGNPLSSFLFYRSEAYLIGQFLASLPQTNSSDARVRQSSLLGNVVLRRARDLRVNNSISRQELSQKFGTPRHTFWLPFCEAAMTDGSALPWPYRLTNESFLTPFRAERQGIILLAMHAHYSLLTGPMLYHLGFEPITFLGMAVARRILKERYPADTSLQSSGVWGELVKKAYVTLRQGGVVLMAGDGRGGRGATLLLPVCGRLHPFKAGFAEIALHSGAAVIPITTTLEADGRIRITFHPPLDPGAGDLPQSARVERLLRQYASFLEKMWRGAPENIDLRHMAWHLRLPAAHGHFNEKD